DEKKVFKLANKLFGQVQVYEWSHASEDLSFAKATKVEMARPINQVHCVLGSTAYSIYDNRKTGLLLLNSLLGGFGMASILNLNIREKYGIAYTIESNYSLYSDTGLFSVYFGTDEEKAERALKLVHKELNKLREQPLSAGFLDRAKTKFKGQIALAEENRMSMIIAEAKNLLDYDRVISLQEVFAKIDAVTVEEIHGISQDLFAE